MSFCMRTSAMSPGVPTNPPLAPVSSTFCMKGMSVAPGGVAVLYNNKLGAREYQADVASSRLTGDPLALARALRKIELGADAYPMAATGALAAAGHLMVVSPFRSRGLGRLFATHPPVAERVRRLESQAGCPR